MFLEQDDRHATAGQQQREHQAGWSSADDTHPGPHAPITIQAQESSGPGRYDAVS